MSQTRYLLQGKSINPCTSSGTPSWTFACLDYDEAVEFAHKMVSKRNPDRLVETVRLKEGVTLFIAHAAIPMVYVLTERH